MKGCNFIYRKVISLGKTIVESQPTFRRHMSQPSIGLTSNSSIIYQCATQEKQTNAKTAAKLSVYQILSIIVVFLVLVFKIQFVSVVSKSLDRRPSKYHSTSFYTSCWFCWSSKISYPHNRLWRPTCFKMLRNQYFRENRTIHGG
jgi:hypothetical protein